MSNDKIQEGISSEQQVMNPIPSMSNIQFNENTAHHEDHL